MCSTGTSQAARASACANVDFARPRRTAHEDGRGAGGSGTAARERTPRRLGPAWPQPRPAPPGCVEGPRRPHPGPPGHARHERHQRACPGAAGPDARAVGDVVGDVQSGVAQRGRAPGGRAPSRRSGRDDQGERRRPPGPAGDQPERRARGTRPAPGRPARAAPRGPCRRRRSAAGHRHRVAHQAAQALGEDGDGRRQGARASSGRRASARAQTASDQAENCTGASASPWRRARGAGRRAVEGLARQEGAQGGRAVVRDGARRHVAHVPPGLAQPPHQVDVLAAPQRRVEQLGPGRHVGPDDQRRARHEGDAGSRPHRPPAGPGRARTARAS